MTEECFTHRLDFDIKKIDYSLILKVPTRKYQKGTFGVYKQLNKLELLGLE